MNVVPITDYLQRGLDRLLEQYKGKPVLAAILESWLIQFQQIEDMLLAVKASRMVDTATGYSLAKIARKVRAPLGDTDEQTRLRIKLEIRARRSNGRAEDLIEIIRIAQQALDPDGSTGYEENYPAGVELRLDVDDPAEIHAYAKRAKLGGVKLRSLYLGDTSKPAFRFAAYGGGGSPVTSGGFSSTAGGVSDPGTFRGVLT